MEENKIYFSDFFDVSRTIIEEYGAMDISLLNDLPLFIDPFLIFCSEDQRCQDMHSKIIKYLLYLRDKAIQTPSLSATELKYLYCFPEVKQTYLGFCRSGNAGSGLGLDFAHALHNGLKDIFKTFGEETITHGQHIEKVCLLRPGVGRDNISDFITNLIMPFLLEYTESFAKKYLRPEQCKTFAVSKVRFDYDYGIWRPEQHLLPCYNGDYVLLTPTSLLVRDDTWISRADMIRNFQTFAMAIPDPILRDRVNAHFVSMLSKKPKKDEKIKAAEYTIQQYPVLIDHYIRFQEDNERAALSRSLEDVTGVKHVFLEQLLCLVDDLKKHTDFYKLKELDSYAEAIERVMYLKHVVEDCDGYRWFYDGDNPIRRESDLHLMFKLACCNTVSDANAEVNNGRGPVDFKFSQGSKDSTLVEFKLARTLKRNLEKQVEVYKNANATPKAIKVIMFFTDEEYAKVLGILNDLGLTGKPGIVLIDARNDKIQASKAV